MQEGRILTPTEVNRDLLRSILDTPRWFWPGWLWCTGCLLESSGAETGWQCFTLLWFCWVPIC